VRRGVAVFWTKLRDFGFREEIGGNLGSGFELHGFSRPR